MKKLYDYGIFMLDIGQSFKVPHEGWHLEENLPRATEKQQEWLIKIGWGRQDNMSKNGAEHLISALKEMCELHRS